MPLPCQQEPIDASWMCRDRHEVDGVAHFCMGADNHLGDHWCGCPGSSWPSRRPDIEDLWEPVEGERNARTN